MFTFFFKHFPYLNCPYNTRNSRNKREAEYLVGCAHFDTAATEKESKNKAYSQNNEMYIIKCNLTDKTALAIW